MRLGALVAIILLVGCGVPGAEDPTLRAPTTTLISPELADGLVDGSTVVQCTNGPEFPLSALDEIVDVDEAGIEGLQRAMATFLDSEEGRFWPQDGWMILDRSDDRILVVNHSEEHGLAFMSIDDDADGLTWSGASSPADCPLVIPTPEGLNTVDWVLDPGHPAPGPDSVVIHVLVTERQCVSGIETGDRLLGPEVHYLDDQVRIGFAATPPPGEAHDCQGNPSTPVEVQLDEPLGDREVGDLFALGTDLRDYLD